MAAISTTDRGDWVSVRLPADLDLGCVPELAEALIEALGVGKPIIVDAASVETASTGSIQVLISLSAKLNKSRLRIENPSDALAETFRVLGLEGWLAGWSRR